MKNGMMAIAFILAIFWKVQPLTALQEVPWEVKRVKYAMANICQYAQHEYGLRITAERFPNHTKTNALNNQADKIRAHCNAAKRIPENNYAGTDKWIKKLGRLAVTEGNSLIDHLYSYGDQYEAKFREYYLCDERVRKSFRAVHSVGLKYSHSSYHKGINQAFSKWEKSRDRACPVNTSNLELAREGFKNRNAFFKVVKKALRGQFIRNN